MFGEIALGVIIVSPLILFVGMAYGDYKEEGKFSWQSKKSGVNSGAKFG